MKRIKFDFCLLKDTIESCLAVFFFSIVLLAANLKNISKIIILNVDETTFILEYVGLLYLVLITFETPVFF